MKFNVLSRFFFNPISVSPKSHRPTEQLTRPATIKMIYKCIQIAVVANFSRANTKICLKFFFSFYRSIPFLPCFGLGSGILFRIYGMLAVGIMNNNNNWT